MLLFNSLTQDLLGVLVAFLLIIITYFKWSYQYWKRKGLPYLEPSIPFGNVGNAVRGKEHMGFTLRRIYKEMKKRNWKHGGFYVVLSPSYLVLDLDYIKNILTKDFDHFVDRVTYYNEEDDPLSAHFGVLTGEKWKNLRSICAPTFTPSKIKSMFQNLLECERSLIKKMNAEIGKKKSVDIQEICTCFTTDIIGCCAFGLDCKSFEDENSPFRVYVKKQTASMRSQNLKLYLSMNFPKLANKLRLTMTTKDVADFFMKVMKDTVEYREKNNYTRKDFMQMLIDLKNNKFVGDDGQIIKRQTLTMNQLFAQSFVFFLGGLDAPSKHLAFTLYELSRNQDMQEKLREEINTVLAKHDGQITYDALLQMEYMDQVINESLRKHPATGFLNRVCVKDYKLPNDDIIIKKGTPVYISTLGINHDEEYYPDPDRFDPERFNEENKKSRPHFAHLPFGEGPRYCIGQRFGIIQSKIGLTSLLKNYKFSVNKKTKEPLKMQAIGIIMSVDGGIWLDAQKI